MVKTWYSKYNEVKDNNSAWSELGNQEVFFWKITTIKNGNLSVSVNVLRIEKSHNCTAAARVEIWKDEG